MRERISTRVREALQARHARGQEHPKNNNITEEIRLKAAKAISVNARTDAAVVNAKGYIEVLRSIGKSYRQIATILNAEGKRTK